MSDHSITLRCACGDEHVDIDLFFDISEEDNYLTITSGWTHRQRDWRAVWAALRGRKHIFSEIVLDREDVERLREFFEDVPALDAE